MNYQSQCKENAPSRVRLSLVKANSSSASRVCRAKHQTLVGDQSPQQQYGTTSSHWQTRLTTGNSSSRNGGPHSNRKSAADGVKRKKSQNTFAQLKLVPKDSSVEKRSLFLQSQNAASTVTHKSSKKLHAKGKRLETDYSSATPTRRKQVKKLLADRVST